MATDRGTPARSRFLTAVRGRSWHSGARFGLGALPNDSPAWGLLGLPSDSASERRTRGSILPELDPLISSLPGHPLEGRPPAPAVAIERHAAIRDLKSAA